MTTVSPLAGGLFSERMARIDTSEIRRMFALAATLKNPINLSIGQPHFPAPAPVRDAISEALARNQTTYTQTQGIVELRERLSRKFSEANGFEAHPDRILISSGVSSLIQLLFMATIDPGDRVLLTDPAFLIYRSLLEFLGAQIEYIPENFTADDMAAFRAADQAASSADRNRRPLKLIIFCTPSNPSGHIMTDDQIRMLANLAEDKGALLVADEIYELFDYENRFKSAAAIYPNTVTFMGYSKSYSMTGLRLSAATGPESVIKAMTTLQQYTVVCAPAPVQWAGIAALDLDMSTYVGEYKTNRDYCLERLRDKLEFTYPAGAFYIFARIPGTDREFVERAIQEKELLVVPGRIFSRSEDRVRISYATDRSTLERGMDALLALI
ncbi:MAG: aminotransferase class I/II-fold pyridoxal phosphate-dependent enzyme [bacterium]|nr:aminotransferase class I/II-fold pyridoxal phosphate-dependent enzyme [bacterium]